MSRRIIVTTGARLHFGLLSNRAAASRNFGGAGLMIDKPGFQVSVRHADRDSIQATDSYHARIGKIVADYRRNAPSDKVPPACEIELQQEIPPHVGLGSGTQLAMAVAQALAILANDGQANAATLAGRVGRGKRSSIGIHGFDKGGLLVDGGKLPDDVVGDAVTRIDFPLDWRIVLITPQGRAGLSGEPEIEAFRELPGMSAEMSHQLNALLQAELLPAVAAADFARCGESLFEFGRLVGEYFGPVQGGVYADGEMAKLVTELRSAGVRGVGQTSWGPTIFALAPGESDAQSLAADLAKNRHCREADVRMAAPLNIGAAIDIRAD